MGRVNEVLDRAIKVIVLGFYLAPIVLYALLVVCAFLFYVVGWAWPCDWPLHESLNPRCPSPDLAD
jgi:hypothetical protein